MAAPPERAPIQTGGELSSEAVEASWAFLVFLMLALATVSMAAFFR